MYLTATSNDVTRCYMKLNTIPLALPTDIHRDIRRVSKITSLSQADVMRHSIRIGLPEFEAKFPQPRQTTTTSPAKKTLP